MKARSRASRPRARVALAAAVALSVGFAIGRVGAAHATPPSGSPGETPARHLFFGDLHVHSGWSFDAFLSGVSARPRDAYLYARGAAIEHVSGESIQLSGPPLDFMALTDHAEYLGVPQAAADPRTPLGRTPLARAWMGQDESARRQAQRAIQQSYQSQQGLPALTSTAVIQPAWVALRNLANEMNSPGRFTAFVGFEYSASPEGRNLHRNVLFRGGTVPSRPFSAMDSGNPEDLWRWMDAFRARGHDVLAIPHNPNGSDGWAFAETRYDGSPIDRAWIELRSRNEPSAEIFQIKGQSEAHPRLSPDDPWADYEVIDVRTLRIELQSRPEGSYWRHALRRGLSLEAEHAANPYRLGAVGSTDGHNAASPVDESSYSGKIGRTDATPVARLEPFVPGPGRPPGATLLTRWGSAAGLAGIWAEENTRASLFDALRRRETFGTSGPRIRLRLFAGWDFGGDAAGDHARVGYARGVPMGGVLPAPSTVDAVPTLLVAAQRDPLEAPLERLQIVKGWRRGDATFERVFDVACMGGAAPDPSTHRCPRTAPPPSAKSCRRVDEVGAAELATRWRDPDYDPETSVFYYARVLQVPTCRWSTWDALRLEREPPAGVPAFVQERAIGSPVWVEPRRADAVPE